MVGILNPVKTLESNFDIFLILILLDSGTWFNIFKFYPIKYDFWSILWAIHKTEFNIFKLFIVGIRLRNKFFIVRIEFCIILIEFYLLKCDYQSLNRIEFNVFQGFYCQNWVLYCQKWPKSLFDSRPYSSSAMKHHFRRKLWNVIIFNFRPKPWSIIIFDLSYEMYHFRPKLWNESFST